MAYGPTITLTHAGASSTPIFISDIRMRTDGPHYAAGNPAGGGCYVPESGSRELPYTGDVARSYESGAIRSFVDNGEITVAWTHGTEYADAFSQVENFQATLTNTSDDVFVWIAPTACKVLSVHAYAEVVPVNGGTYTAAFEGAGNNLLTATNFSMETLVADTDTELTLTATTANLTLAAGDMVKVTLAASSTFSAGSACVVFIEWAHR